MEFDFGMLAISKKPVRPICDMPDCRRLAHHTGQYRKDGSIIWRYRSGIGYMCAHCHDTWIKIDQAEQKNFINIGIITIPGPISITAL